MRKRAFTRIELIAIIVILAIGAFALAGMLLPAGSHGHGGGPRSPRSACMSNLKQIGTAIVMYRDQNDKYPFGRIADPEDPKIIIGHVTPRSALGPDGKGSKDIKDLAVFKCPSRSKQTVGYQCINGVPNEDQMYSSHAILRDFETSHGADKQIGFVLRGDMSVSGITGAAGTSWITDPKAQPPLDEDGKTQLGWIDNAP